MAQPSRTGEFTEMRATPCDPRQTTVKKVLCVCFGNQLRSPTVSVVLSQPPYNFNTRSCGLDPGSAVCLIDEVMVRWADEIVTMEDSHTIAIKMLYPDLKAPIVQLNIPDHYNYRDPTLMALIAERYKP